MLKMCYLPIGLSVSWFGIGFRTDFSFHPETGGKFMFQFD